MKSRTWMIASAAGFVATIGTSRMMAAALEAAPLFQDGAVLQRGIEVPVWGSADPGSEVTVEFAGTSATATSSDQGKWMAMLPKMEARKDGAELTISSGNQSIVLQDVRVGEVWLASGQSNMEWQVSGTRVEDKAIANSGPVPLLRIFETPHVLSHERRSAVGGQWKDATPETVADFSAIAYFFGRELVGELDVPVGMIESSWGGSRIEPWFAEEGLEGVPELAELRARRLAGSPGFPEFDQAFGAHITATRNWTDAAETAWKAGTAIPPQPTGPQLLNLGSNAEIGTYQAMIHPLVPYGLRGFLWYQGESNNGEGMLYRAKMEALIKGWRHVFNRPDAPFLYVQLAPYRYGGPLPGALPELWEAQEAVLAIPNTGMAVITDIGDLDDIHPTNKSDVAHRLALWALADTYGREVPVKSGPLFQSAKFEDGAVTLEFDHLGSGLATRDGEAPNSFELAGEDGNFHPASAEISEDGTSITLKSAEVPDPQQARHAWSTIAQPNAINQEGLPMSAFRAEKK